MHSGRNVKLLFLRFKVTTWSSCKKPLEKKSSYSLQSSTAKPYTFEHTIELTFSSPSSDFTHCSPLQLEASKKSNLGIMTMLLGNKRIPQSRRDKVLSPTRFWNETGNSFKPRLTNSRYNKFFISPNISGKFSRLEHCESSSISREVKLRGGNVVSLLQNLALNILSLFRKPIEWWTVIKFPHRSNESFSKFGRSDMSRISIKNSQSSKFKTFRFLNFCKRKNNGKKRNKN